MILPNPSTLTLAERLTQGALQLGGRVLDFTLPPRCVACAGPVPTQGDLCANCWSGLHFMERPFCRQCGYPTPDTGSDDPLCGRCAKRAPAFDRARAVLRYDGGSKRLILAFKHYERLDGLKLFGRWLAQSGEEILDPDALLVPIPLHRWRLFRRGFNQAAQLAIALHRETGTRLCLDLLRKPKATRAQQTLGSAARAKNITANSFAIRATRASVVVDRHIVLIDDVLTTGTTAGAAAKVLKRAGASQVDLLCLARVVQGDRLEAQ